ncbi:MAG: TonB-dependent siderophore receptor [Gammaproteobacteria bacterium]
MLIGFDYYRLEDDGHGVCCPAVAPIDVFNPVYGVVDEAAISAATGENMFSTNNTVWYGLYFQDQITLWDKLHILGGGRYDWAMAVDGFSGTSLADARANETENTDEAFSPGVGLVYQPWSWVSLYGNYVESFGSNNGRPAPGQPQFDPEHGQQYEVGLKTEFWDGRLSSTLAFYHLTKQNVLTADPQNLGFQRAIGEARSQGIELDIAGQLTDQWKLLASYSYTDADIIKDTDCIQFDADFTCLV